MIDFHTHILPEIDDGSKNTDESMNMIKILIRQGVNKIFFTPHFYAYKSDVNKFIYDRNNAYEMVKRELAKNKLDVNLYLGCEVLYFDELWRIDDLDKLCIKNTKYIMIELPFSSWTQGIIACIEKVISKGYIPILAHVDRFLKYKGNIKNVYKLVEDGALIQVNCDFTHNFINKYRVMKMFRMGIVSALGTDCHNTVDRAPNYRHAYDYVKNNLSEMQFSRFIRNQSMIMKDCANVYK